MDLGIQGKAALVCGASKGLGRGCAWSLAREGCRVTLVARDRQHLEKTAAEMRAATGADIIAIAADITTDEGRGAALAACPQPDILVTNAGGPPPDQIRERILVAPTGTNSERPLLQRRPRTNGHLRHFAGALAGGTLGGHEPHNHVTPSTDGAPAASTAPSGRRWGAVYLVVLSRGT